ncbi:leukotriene B4 receptor 1-like [Hoplias malabaricus]|uniref:leukotriene B4 receptor 1-like n=1 Tax=Hoplias malabaricus TaxID=27720 RepID=UPI003462D372
MEHLNCSFNSTSDPVLSSRQWGPFVVLGLCCVVGLPSNIAVIISIVRQWSQNISFTVKLMLNLAVSDSLTLGLAPIAMYGLLHGWTLGLLPCQILTYLTYCAMYASVLTVTLMAVHHYHTIKSKIANRVELERLQKGRRRLLIAGLWGLSIVFALPVFFTRGVEKKRNSCRCQKSITDTTGKVAFLVLEIVLGFVLPFSIILTSYWWINKTKLQGGQSVRKRKNRMRRLVISIVTAFFLLWTPVHIINMIDVGAALTKESFPAVYSELKSFRRATGDLSKTLSVINCCVNPFLYAVALGVFKKKSNNQKNRNKRRVLCTGNDRA